MKRLNVILSPFKQMEETFELSNAQDISNKANIPTLNFPDCFGLNEKALKCW